MSFTGQPAPTTVYNVGYGKISDGNSVKVKVTAGESDVSIVAGKFYYLEGFLGAAMQSVTIPANQTGDVILNVEAAEFETDQTKTTDRDNMDVGDDIFWDDTEKEFTLTAKAVYAGKITSAPDAKGVIWFKASQHPHGVDDVTQLEANLGDLAELTTTAKTSAVDAINELNGAIGDKATLDTTAKTTLVAAINELAGRKANKVEAIADVESLDISDATDLKAVATALNAVIANLISAGIMKSA